MARNIRRGEVSRAGGTEFVGMRGAAAFPTYSGFFVGAAQGMAVLSKVSSDPGTVRDIARVSISTWPVATVN